MDENKNIENKIRESFGGVKKAAPTDLWNKLSDELSVSHIDENIDTKIKNGFENISKVAPLHVWGSVNRQLNVERVWKKISKELDRRPIIIFWRKMAIVAVLLLLLFSGSIYVIKNNFFSSAHSQQVHETQKNKQIVKTRLSPITTSSISISNKKESITLKSIAETSAQTRNFNAVKHYEARNSQKKYTMEKYNIHGGNNSTSNILIEKSEIVFSEGSAPEEADSISFIALMPININLKDSAIDAELMPQSLSLFENTLKEPILKKKRFEVGIIYSYNNTWLVNNDTRKSFDENSLIQAIPIFSGSYGIVANYYILKNSAVSAEFFVNSKYTQRYDEFVEGVFNRRTTEFNYYKLALLYQFNISQSPYKVFPSKYTFKAGFYGSILKNHTHNYSRVMNLETDTYTKGDYGARVAIGQEKTFKRIIMGYGLNVEYGFKNIFEGNIQVPAKFNISRNALIGGYLNLKYSF